MVERLILFPTAVPIATPAPTPTAVAIPKATHVRSEPIQIDIEITNSPLSSLNMTGLLAQ